jgi:hypothetical protein
MKKNAILSIILGLLLLLSSSVSPGAHAGEPTFNLEVTPDCGFNMLEWEAVPGATQYFIYRGNAPGEEFNTPLLDFPIQETHFKDEINIKNGQEYCYFITALNSKAEEFATSTEACAIPSCYQEPDEDECKLVLRYQQDNTMYFANGEQKGPMETPPVNKHSRLFLVIRYVTEEIPGTTIDWVSATKQVIITTRDGKRIELQIGNNNAVVDGQTTQIDPNNPDVVPYISEGRTLCPMRFVAENLGATGPNDIKWYGDTKTVELRFDDPMCEKCDWVGGEVIPRSKEYYLASKQQHQIQSVLVKMCSGQRRIIHLPEKIKANNSDDYLSSYKGNARFCFHEGGRLVEWEAHPGEDVCDEVSPDVYDVCICIEVEQVLCDEDSVSVLGHTSRGTDYVVAIPPADNVSCDYFQVGHCYEFCGMMTFNFANRTLLPAETFSEVDCPCPCEDCSWIMGEIIGSTSYTTGSMRIYAIVVETCEDGEMTYRSSTDFEDMGSSGFTISDYEGCARICVNEDGAVVRWEAMPDLEDCCGPAETPEPPEAPEPEIECECLEIVRGDCSNFNGIDADGKMWNLLFRDNPDLCEGIEIGRFYEFCGPVTRISHPGTGVEGISMEVSSVTRQDAPCETDCKWIKGEVRAVLGKMGSHTRVMLNTCGMSSRTLITRNNHYDIGRNQPLETYTGCASFCVEDDGETIRMWRIEEGDCCPDSACVNLRLDRVNCDSASPIVYGENLELEGEYWKLEFRDAGMCDGIEEGMCVSACGFVTDKTEDRTVLDTLEIESMECPPTDIIEECICIEVVENDCSANPPTVHAVDAYRNDVTLHFDPDRMTFCERFTAGTYWEVCGEVSFTRAGLMSANKILHVHSALPLDELCTSVCTYVQIERVYSDSGEETFMAYGYDMSFRRWTLYFEEDTGLCDRFVPGNCYNVCGQRRIAEDGGIHLAMNEEMDVETATLTECIELPPMSCFCVEMAEVDLSSEPPTVVAVAGLSTAPFELNLDLTELVPGMYEGIAEGTFWDVCGTILYSRVGGTPEMTVTRMEEREEPCEIRIPGCLCLNITDVSGGNVVGFDREFTRWSIKGAYGDSIVAGEIEVGECWRFCGYLTPLMEDDDDDIGVIMGREFFIVSMEEVECPCSEPEQECIEGEIEIISCGELSSGSILVIRVGAGDRRMLLIPDTLAGVDCSTLEVGQCVNACGVSSVPGSPMVILDSLTVIDCP